MRNRKRGGQSKYSVKLVQKIMESLELGVPMKWAAKANGVTAETFDTWAETRPELLEMVEQAKARFVQAHLANIKQHAREQWTASAWILERCESEQFAKPEVKIQFAQQINAGPVQHSYFLARGGDDIVAKIVDEQPV